MIIGILTKTMHHKPLSLILSVCIKKHKTHKFSNQDFGILLCSQRGKERVEKYHLVLKIKERAS